MSNDMSCIRHTTKRRVLVLDEDYLRICSVSMDGMKHDAHCTAIVLRQMEYWYCVRVKHKPQAEAQNTAAERAGERGVQNTDAWIYKSQREMQDELMGLFGEKAVTSAYSYLLARGFLTARQNPNVGWDRTKQYLFMPQSVQNAVNGAPPPPSEGQEDSPETPPAPFRKNAEWIPQNCAIESADLRTAKRENAESIPQKYGSNTRDYDSKTEAEKQQQQPPTGGEIEDEAVVVVVSSLQKNGVSVLNSRRFVREDGPPVPAWYEGNRLDYLREQIAALRDRHPQNSGKVLTDAIEEGWDFPDAYKDRLKPKPALRVAPPASGFSHPKGATGAPMPDFIKGKNSADLITLFGAAAAEAIAESPIDSPPS